MLTAPALTLCKKSDVPKGEGYKVVKGEFSLAVFQVEGTFFVLDDLCSHGPGSLSEGFLDGHIIECDFHAGCFDIRNGKVTAPPCMIPMRTFRVLEDPENIVIELPTK